MSKAVAILLIAIPVPLFCSKSLLTILFFVPEAKTVAKLLIVIPVIFVSESLLTIHNLGEPRTRAVVATALPREWASCYRATAAMGNLLPREWAIYYRATAAFRRQLPRYRGQLRYPLPRYRGHAVALPRLP